MTLYTNNEPGRLNICNAHFGRVRCWSGNSVTGSARRRRLKPDRDHKRQDTPLCKNQVLLNLTRGMVTLGWLACLPPS
jgi:hypothetical protein